MKRERSDPPWITGIGQARELPQTADLARYLILAAVLLLCALAGWIYLSTTVRVDALAVDIYKLEQKKEELRHEIVRLNADLAQLESLERVRKEAERMGFTPRVPGQQFAVPVSSDESAAPLMGRDGGTAPNLWRRLTNLFGGDGSGDAP